MGGDNVIPLKPKPRDPRRDAERTILWMVSTGGMKIPADEMVPILARVIVELLEERDAPKD